MHVVFYLCSMVYIYNATYTTFISIYNYSTLNHIYVKRYINCFWKQLKGDDLLHTEDKRREDDELSISHLCWCLLLQLTRQITNTFLLQNKNSWQWINICHQLMDITKINVYMHKVVQFKHYSWFLINVHVIIIVIVKVHTIH